MNKHYLLIIMISLSIQYLDVQAQSSTSNGFGTFNLFEKELAEDELNKLQELALKYEKNNEQNLMVDTYKEMLELAHKKKYFSKEAFALTKLGRYYLSINILNKSEHYYRLAFNLCKSQKLSQIIVHKNLVAIFRIKKQADSTIYYQKELLSLDEIKSDKGELSRANGLLADIYLRIGEYKLALKYAIKQLDIAKEIEENNISEKTVENNDDIQTDKFYHKIGKIYFNMANHEFALKNYFKALSIATGKNDLLKAGRYQTSIGNAYYSKEELDSSLIYYLSAMNIAKSHILLTEDDNIEYKIGYGSLLNNIGQVYKKKGEYEKALENCLQSIKIKEAANARGLENSYSGLAEIFLLLREPQKSKKYIDKFIKMTDSLNIKLNSKRKHFLLSMYYEQIGDIAKALYHQKLFAQLKDSIYRIETAETISKIQLNYQSKISEQENKILKAENLNRNILIIVLILAGLLISSVLFSRLRAKKKSAKFLDEKNKLISSKHKELEELYSDLQENEKQLDEANKAKDKFFSIIGHDLKNPLHNLFLSTEMIYTYFDRYTREQLIENIKTMNTSAKSASNLLQNLLTWARSQSGQINFHPNNLKIYYIVEEVFELLQSSAQGKNINLINEVTEGAQVYVDENMINAVIRNLISNSIKFTEISGVISIESKELRDYFKFTIEDTGVGMSPEISENIFKIDSHHSTIGTIGEGGTGLGLILCKEFVDYHGGEIWVESKLGVGSKFHFTLPKHQNTEEIEVPDEIIG
jgi:signal transduction histidine kinase